MNIVIIGHFFFLNGNFQLRFDFNFKRRKKRTGNNFNKIVKTILFWQKKRWYIKTNIDHHCCTLSVTIGKVLFRVLLSSDACITVSVVSSTYHWKFSIAIWTCSLFFFPILIQFFFYPFFPGASCYRQCLLGKYYFYKNFNLICF